MFQASLFLILLSLFGFVAHAFSTYDKAKFSKLDKIVFIILSTGLLVPVMTLFFNLK